MEGEDVVKNPGALLSGWPLEDEETGTDQEVNLHSLEEGGRGGEWLERMGKGREGKYMMYMCCCMLIPIARCPRIEVSLPPDHEFKNRQNKKTPRY